MSISEDNLQAITQSMNFLPSIVNELPLAAFVNLFVYRFDEEALIKSWQSTQFQNTLENIWEQNAKSCVLAPREHLKTSTVLYYLLKKIYTRNHPLEIDYYHLSGSLAEEKFHKLIRIIESNPFLRVNMKPEKAKIWSGKGIELFDGTVIKPLSYQQGVRGKHPHIIVLDDVIDPTVMYSDTKNRKSIEKFYEDIYPMISKQDKEKKIIVIGTVQRKDDLYHSLPEDFRQYTFQAITNKEQQNVLSPELFTFDELMKLKQNISQKFGEKFWDKEYMNMPFEAMGMIIKPEWIQTFSQRPEKLNIYQGWDLAVGKDLDKGDWTVCVTIGIVEENPIKIYILDVYRDRIDFGARIIKIKEKYQEWHPFIIGIEEVTFQYDTIQYLKQQNYTLPIQGVKAITNKIQSFQVELAPYFENRQIFLPYQQESLKQELLSLPVGQFDDQADALKIAIKAANLQPRGGYTIIGGFGNPIPSHFGGIRSKTL